MSYSKRSFLAGLAAGRQMDGWDGKGYAFQPMSNGYMANGVFDGTWEYASDLTGMVATDSNGNWLKFPWGDGNFEIYTEVVPTDLTYECYAFGPYRFSTNGDVGSPWCVLQSGSFQGAFAWRGPTPSSAGFYTRRTFLVIKDSEIGIATGELYKLRYAYKDGVFSFSVTRGGQTVAKQTEVLTPFFVEGSATPEIIFGGMAVAYWWNRGKTRVNLKKTFIYGNDGEIIWGGTQNDD